MSKVYEYSTLIREHHLDTFGHVNNAMYLEILEESRWEILEEHQLGMKRLEELGFGPVILEIKLKFMRELKLREKINIRTTYLQHKRADGRDGKTAEMEQIIFMENGEESCRAVFLFGIFDFKTRKLIEVPQVWRDAFK